MAAAGAIKRCKDCRILYQLKRKCFLLFAHDCFRRLPGCGMFAREIWGGGWSLLETYFDWTSGSAAGGGGGK